MPIPDFDKNQVLPPHLGDPRYPNQLSPYPTTTEEVCVKFATTDERREILRGWLAFRQRLTALGVHAGFQWLDGSFLENIELSERRAPKDLDLVTFYVTPAGTNPNAFLVLVTSAFPEFVDRDAAKRTFHLDHFPVTLTADPAAVVENTRYWTGLFSHRRDGVWKGMLRVELNTPTVDNAAAAILQPIAHVP
jgi:hypothetical protein